MLCSRCDVWAISLRPSRSSPSPLVSVPLLLGPLPFPFPSLTLPFPLASTDRNASSFPSLRLSHSPPVPFVFFLLVFDKKFKQPSKNHHFFGHNCCIICSKWGEIIANASPRKDLFSSVSLLCSICRTFCANQYFPVAFSAKIRSISYLKTRLGLNFAAKFTNSVVTFILLSLEFLRSQQQQYTLSSVVVVVVVVALDLFSFCQSYIFKISLFF